MDANRRPCPQPRQTSCRNWRLFVSIRGSFIGSWLPAEEEFLGVEQGPGEIFRGLPRLSAMLFQVRGGVLGFGGRGGAREGEPEELFRRFAGRLRGLQQLVQAVPLARE